MDLDTLSMQWAYYLYVSIKVNNKIGMHSVWVNKTSFC